jgi:membrane-associated HD superfamily phosphohydrolase
MKINFKSKKFIIPIIIVVIVLVFASVLGYRYYQEQELQKKIDTAIAEIEKTETDFNKEDTREDKLALLQSISKEHVDYEKSKDVIKEIDEKYHSVISDMQKVFREEYDKTLTDNTLKEIDKIYDKEKLNTTKTNLHELLQTIQNEKDIICMEDEVKEYETEITNLIKSYEDRITKIEEEEKKAAEEAAKQAEEEARKQAEAAASSNNGGGNYNSGGSGSYNNGSSGSWHRYDMPDGSWTHYDHNNDGSWTAHDDKGNSL